MLTKLIPFIILLFSIVFAYGTLTDPTVIDKSFLLAIDSMFFFVGMFGVYLVLDDAKVK